MDGPIGKICLQMVSCDDGGNGTSDDNDAILGCQQGSRLGAYRSEALTRKWGATAKHLPPRHHHQNLVVRACTYVGHTVGVLKPLRLKSKLKNKSVCTWDF